MLQVCLKRHWLIFIKFSGKFRIPKDEEKLFLLRLRPTTIFEEWINRCWETIKSFPTTTKKDSFLVKKIVVKEQTEY
jgi:hypothetical protein